MSIPNAFEYRPGMAADALCVGALATQVFLDTYATEGIGSDLAREAFKNYSPEAVLARLADPDTFFILSERQAHLVGFAEMSRNRPCPVAAVGYRFELVRLYVQRRFQRQVLGRTLTLQAEALARREAAAGVWLAAWSGNDRALAFYSALQYENVGTTEYVSEGRAYENMLFVKVLPVSTT